MSKSVSPVRGRLIDAFLDLLDEKFYMDITVTDLVNHAHVARASFYRHFHSMNDIVDLIADEICASFIEDVYPALMSGDERKLREYLFRYFYQLSGHEDKLANVSPQNTAIFLSRIDARMKAAEIKLPENTVQEKYAVTAKLGLINSISRKWMKDGMKETPEELINYIMSVITLF